MNDQAKKLRELAQRIREERERANLIIDPTSSEPELLSINQNASTNIKEPVARKTQVIGKNIPLIMPVVIEPELKKTEDIDTDTSSSSSLSGISFNTRVIAVSSGKGGVGKSNLVTNLGIALAMRNKKVLILDADLGLANLDVLFGINPKYNLNHLVSNEKTMSDILVTGPHSLKIVPGGSGIPELANLSGERQRKLLESFMELERDADITLIDTGAGISKNIITFILAAQEALIITTPEPTAITDAYGLIKVLTQEDKDVDIKLVVNMVSGEREGLEIANRIIMAAKQFLNKRIEILGYIASDPAVNVSVKKQEPFIIGYPNSRASRCIMQIASSLDNESKNHEQKAPKDGFRGFLLRLFER